MADRCPNCGTAVTGGCDENSLMKAQIKKLLEMNEGFNERLNMVETQNKDLREKVRALELKRPDAFQKE